MRCNLANLLSVRSCFIWTVTGTPERTTSGKRSSVFGKSRRGEILAILGVALQSPSARVPSEKRIVVEQTLYLRSTANVSQAMIDSGRYSPNCHSASRPAPRGKGSPRPRGSGRKRRTIRGGVGVTGKWFAVSHATKSCSRRWSTVCIGGQMRRTEETEGLESCSFVIVSSLGWASRKYISGVDHRAAAPEITGCNPGVLEKCIGCPLMLYPNLLLIW
jgi:hypothetical protein